MKKNNVNRKCVVLNKVFPVNELLRIVKTKDNKVIIDYNKKIEGRGAYIYKKVDKSLYKTIYKKRVFNKTFKMNINTEFYDEVISALKGE